MGTIGAEGFDATGGGEMGVSSSLSRKLIERLFLMNSGSSSSLALVFDSFRTIEDLFGPPLFFSNCLWCSIDHFHDTIPTFHLLVCHLYSCLCGATDHFRDTIPTVLLVY